MRPAPLIAYGLATRLLAPLAPMALERRARRGKEDRSRLGERLGRTTLARPPGRLAWLHGASVGESLSLLPLVSAIGAARPDVAVLVTSGTCASAELMVQRLPAAAAHQYAPLDTPGAVGRFLDHWRPDMGVFVESELWPNLLLAARAQGVRLALLSAQLSQASVQGWLRTPGSAKAVLGAFELILAKDAPAAAALRSLGAVVDGLADLKFGAEPLPVDPAALAAVRGQVGERPLILAASTHPGEDEMVIEAFNAAHAEDSALLVIAPRHADRGPAIAELARSHGARVALRSAGQSPGAATIYVADTLGELGLWYRMAQLAILGGGFIPGVGGHNPLEPGRLSCPFVSGPHVDNWAGAYADLWRLNADGPVETAAALARRIAEAIAAGPGNVEATAKARAYVEARDAEARTVPTRILALLP